MATFPKIAALTLAFAAGAMSLPAAAAEPSPTGERIVITTTEEPGEAMTGSPIDVREIWVGDARRPPTIADAAKRRWDEVHRRLDSGKARREKG